jgi:hypothetical protein
MILPYGRLNRLVHYTATTVLASTYALYWRACTTGQKTGSRFLYVIGFTVFTIFQIARGVRVARWFNYLYELIVLLIPRTNGTDTLSCLKVYTRCFVVSPAGYRWEWYGVAVFFTKHTSITKNRPCGHAQRTIVPYLCCTWYATYPKLLELLCVGKKGDDVLRMTPRQRGH